MKTQTQKNKEKKDKRTFKEGTSLGTLQDRLTELEQKVEELKNA